jgi:YHS domain-containing protein
MSDTSDLAARIDGVISATKDKMKASQQELLQDYVDRQKRLDRYAEKLPRLLEVARPRLELLAKRFGERVEVTPQVSGNTRSVRFAFKSPLAHITMAISAYPDREAKNVAVEYDLQIIPVLMQFESHAEYSTPIDNPDTAGLGKWLDDRIVGFVDTFMKMHESEYYTKDQYVEDPVAKVRFPKFAAGATLEHNGQTYYFVDERTKQEFVQQKGAQKA